MSVLLVVLGKGMETESVGAVSFILDAQHENRSQTLGLTNFDA